jgi:hypothetical protein
MVGTIPRWGEKYNLNPAEAQAINDLQPDVLRSDRSIDLSTVVYERRLALSSRPGFCWTTCSCNSQQAAVAKQ